MSISAECLIEQGMIRLPESLCLPDGIRVKVNIELFQKAARRKKFACEIAGCWKNDTSINDIFSEIEDARSSYLGREITMP